MSTLAYPFKMSEFFSYATPDGKEKLKKARVQEVDDDEEALYESFLGLVYRLGYGGQFPHYSGRTKWHGAVDVPHHQPHLNSDQNTPAGKLQFRALCDGIVVGARIDSAYSGWGNGGWLVLVKHTLPDNKVFYARYGHAHNLLCLDVNEEQKAELKRTWKEQQSEEDKIQWTKKMFAAHSPLPHLRPGAQLKKGDPIGPLGYLRSGHHLHLEIFSQTRWEELEPTMDRKAAEAAGAEGANHVLAVTGDSLGASPKSWYANLPREGWYLYHPIHFIHVVNKGEDLNLNPRRPALKGNGDQKPKPKPHAEGGDVEIKKTIQAKVLDDPEIHKLGADRSFNSKDKQLHSTAVRLIQQALADLGYSLGTSGPNKNGVDGDYGKRTTKAVAKFQEDHQTLVETWAKVAGVDPRTDGVMDWPTLIALSLSWILCSSSGGVKQSPPANEKKEPQGSEFPDEGSPPPKSEPPADDGAWRFPHPGYKESMVRAAKPKRTEKHRLEGGIDYKGVLNADLDPNSTDPKVLIAIPMVYVEGGRFDSVNMYDVAIFTWGFSQWTVHAGSLQTFLRYVKNKEPEVFQKVFVEQGIDVPAKKPKNELTMIIDGRVVDSKAELRRVFKGSTVDRTPPPDAPVGQPYGEDWTDAERRVMMRWCEVFVSAAHHKRIQELQLEYAVQDEIPRCFGKNFDGWRPLSDTSTSSPYYKYKDRWADKGYGNIKRYLDQNLWAQTLLYGLWVNNRIMAYKFFADAIDACRERGLDWDKLGDVYYELVTAKDAQGIDSWKLPKTGRAAKIKDKFDKVLNGRKLPGLKLL